MNFFSKVWVSPRILWSCAGCVLSMNIHFSYAQVPDEETIQIQENSLGFCDLDGSVDSDNNGYTGSGFANTDNEEGNGLTWSISGTSGLYTFMWQFANGSSANRTAVLYINGRAISTAGFVGTGGWSSWSRTSTQLSTNGGAMLVRLEANQSSGLANIDYLEVTGPDVVATSDCDGNEPEPEPEPDIFAPDSMGFVGCSMAENTSSGYRSVGGRRMWGPYGTGGDVVQNWTNSNSAAWSKFDKQADRFGLPNAVWVQICIFASIGVNYGEVRSIIANARQHAAPGATIYISGQPIYDFGHICRLAGSGGPELTDAMAQQAARDSSLDVVYAGSFGPLGPGRVSDTCHANSVGEEILGQQALETFGR